MSNILIIKTSEHESVVAKMSESIENTILTYGFSTDQFVIPTLSDVPLVINILTESKSYDAIIVIGLVINDLGNDTKKILFKNTSFNLQESSLYFGMILGLCAMYDEDLKNAESNAQTLATSVANSTCQMIKTIRQLNSLGNEEYATGKLHN